MKRMKKLCSCLLGLAMLVTSLPFTPVFAAGALDGITLNESYTDDFILPDGFAWTSSDPTVVLPAGEKAVVAPGLFEKTVKLTASDGSGTRDFTVTVPAGTLSQDEYYVNEDFEDIEINAEKYPYGTLPASKLENGASMWWRRDGITDDDKNITGKFGVCEESGNPGNQVYAVDNNNRYVYLDFDGAAADVPTVMDYRIKKKNVASYANIWVNHKHGMPSKYDKVLTFLPGADNMVAQTIKGNTEIAAADDIWYTVRIITDNQKNKLQIYLLENGKFILKLEDQPLNNYPPKQMMIGTDSGKKLELLEIDDMQFYPDKWSVVGNELKFTEDLSMVTENLTLPAAAGTQVTWYSSNPVVVAADGTVKRPVDRDAEVTLYAVASKEGHKRIVPFPMTVKRVSETLTALQNLEMTFADGDSSDQVSKDFQLPVSIEVGGETVPVAWTSDQPSIVAVGDQGRAVAAPNYVNREVILTASASEEGERFAVNYPVTVVKGRLGENNMFINEDFESVETVGDLPQEKNGVKWARQDNAEPSAFETGNGSLGMYLDNGNKVMRVYREKGTVNFPRNYLVYVLADNLPAPEGDAKEDIIFEYDYNLKSLTGTDVKAWMTTANVPGLGSQYLRAEIKDNSFSAGFTVSDLPNGQWHSAVLASTVAGKAENRALELYVDDVFQGKGGADKLQPNGGTYVKNIAFGFDTGAAKSGELLVDNVRAYPNVWKALSEIDIESEVFKNNLIVSADSVHLPGEINGASVRWVTTDASLMEEDGTVHRPTAENKTMTLYALLEKQSVKVLVPVELTVAAKGTAADIAGDLGSLITYATGDDAESVSQNIACVTGQPDGMTVVWDTDQPEVLYIDAETGTGYVACGETDRIVNLTATVTKKGETATGSVKLRVLQDASLKIAGSDFESGELDGWVKDSRSSNFDEADGNYVKVTEEGGRKYLVLKRGDNTTNTQAHNIIHFVLPEILSGKVTVSADVRLAEVPSKWDNKIFDTQAGKDTDAGNNFANIKNGFMESQYYKGAYSLIGGDSTKAVLIPSVDKTKWYHLSYELDTDRGTVSASVDGELMTPQPVPALNAEAEIGQFTMLIQAASTSEIHLDNFEVRQKPPVIRDRVMASLRAENTVVKDRVITCDRIVLPSLEGYTAQWFSSNPAVLGHDGVVAARPAQDSPAAEVKLYGVFTSQDGKNLIAGIPVKVLQEIDDRSAVEEDLGALSIDRVVLGDLDVMKETAGENLTQIGWQSSNDEIITQTGLVTRGGSDKTVTLTATVSKGNESQTKPFRVLVPARGTDPTATTANYSTYIRNGYGAYAANENLIMDKAGDTANKRKGYLKIAIDDARYTGYHVKYLLRLSRSLMDGFKNPDTFEVHGMPNDKLSLLGQSGISYAEAETNGLAALDNKLTESPLVGPGETVMIDVTDFVLRQKAEPGYNGEVGFMIANSREGAYTLLGLRETNENLKPAMVIQRTYDDQTRKVQFTDAGGQAIQSLQTGTIRATVTLENVEDRQNLRLIAALYRNGILEESSIIEGQSIQDGAYENTVTIDVVETQGRELKILLWDENCAPVIDAQRLN